KRATQAFGRVWVGRSTSNSVGFSSNVCCTESFGNSTDRCPLPRNSNEPGNPLDDQTKRKDRQAVEDIALAQERGDDFSFWEEFSEAEREEYRRAYLLRRFWRSAVGFWGRHGARLA